jgi:hypothetical protein
LTSAINKKDIEIAFKLEKALRLDILIGKMSVAISTSLDQLKSPAEQMSEKSNFIIGAMNSLLNASYHRIPIALPCLVNGYAWLLRYNF